jgi:hypothetical protein
MTHQAGSDALDPAELPYYHYTRPQLAAAGVERLEHVREQLVEGMVYMPRPAELNDPFDCRPCLVRPSDVQREAYILRRGSEMYPGREARTIRRQRRSWARRRLGDRDQLQTIWNRSASQHGVLSLSKTHRNHHLWTEYAQSHTGLCIEYNFSRSIEPGLHHWYPLEVEYTDVRPELNILDYREDTQASIEEFIQKSFLSKTRQWQPEDEVRIVYPVHGLIPPKVRIPAGTITGIYLGVSMVPADREAVVSWKGRVPVFEMYFDSEGQLAYRPHPIENM